MSQDGITWHPVAVVRKFTNDDAEYVRRAFEPCRCPVDGAGLMALCKPYETVRSDGNLVTTAGLDRLTKLIIGSGSPQALSNGHARLGVGNGTGTAAIGDTDLSASAGSTNRWFQAADASYPSQSNGVITVQATFASGDGNFAWNEWGLDFGTSSGNTVTAPLLNHRTSAALGTKTSGGPWVLTVTLTLA